MPPDSTHVQYTLEMLVLKALSLAPMHGWGIGQRINQLSDGAFEVQQGSLYPALHRLEKRGWLTSEWKRTEHGRRARYYRITPEGDSELAGLRRRWEGSAWAVRKVLDAEAGS